MSTAHVLAGLGSVLSSDGGIAGGATQDLYELSRPCEMLDYFVSHSWRQGRWIKLFALCKHLHWAFAFALSVVALVVSAAAYFTWAPEGLCTDRQPASVYIRASAVVVVPGVVFAVAMLIGHRVPWLGANPVAAVCSQAAIVRCVERGWRPNACVAVGTAAYAGTLYPLIAIIAGTTVMQPHAGPLLPFSSFALLVALVLGCWGPTWTAPGERRGGEAAAPLLAGAE